MLWAWERPADLGWIDIGRTGVAFLAGTVKVAPDRVSFRPRMQPLKVAAGAYAEAVVRIEIEPETRIEAWSELIERVAAYIENACQAETIKAVQIDFDATTSQRPFYRALMKRLRKDIAPERALGMTALASWCIGDRWLDDMPVSQVVPMLFRMGVDDRYVRSFLEGGGSLATTPGVQAMGFSIDELDALDSALKGVSMPPSRRIYLFAPAGWNSKSARREFSKIVAKIES